MADQFVRTVAGLRDEYRARAMVMLLEDEGDPGEHAVDPGAQGASNGFVLSNGQGDEYLDQDTVPIHEAFRLVKHIVATGSWPTEARWVVDL